MQIEENYKWFEENYNSLSKKYKGYYLIILNKEIIKVFKTIDDAIEFSKKLPEGTFIIQKCEKNKDDLIQVFHSRVRFND